MQRRPRRIGTDVLRNDVEVVTEVSSCSGDILRNLIRGNKWKGALCLSQSLEIIFDGSLEQV